MDQQPSFEFSTEQAPENVVVAGFAAPGLAGLTAADFLADALELSESGHLGVRGLPTVTPFEDGRPRNHTRLFSDPEAHVTVLVGELLVPVGAAGALSDAVLEWVAEEDVDEVVLLVGVPVPHGPEQHRTFHVATEDYREHRLVDAEVPPMGNGFLDGVNGALVERGMNTDLEVGVFVTPVHTPAPDVEAAIRLVETVDDVYDVGVDTDPLAAFAAEVSNYYSELGERMERAADRPERSLPEDRMFM